jgi:multidrug efflux pump subunit AcrA (membrane-fusion protein)
MKSDTKECPYCFTTIDARAIVCPQCRRDIEITTAQSQISAQEQSSESKSSSNGVSRAWIAVAAILGSLLFCALAWSVVYRNLFAPSPVDSDMPQETTNTKSFAYSEPLTMVAAEGTIIPVKEAKLSFTRDSRLSELFISEGEGANEGADLARSAPDRGGDDASETLTAPFTGTIAEIWATEGEAVLAGESVLTIADFDSWLVETTDLTELDVVAVAIGAPVEIEIDSLPGTVLKGTVVEISEVAQLVRGDVTYPVTIQLKDTDDLPLRWGMTVFVSIGIDA